MATVRSAVAAAIKTAREAGRLRPDHEPSAAVALRIAGELGKRELSITDLTRLSTELTKLLDRLPLAPDTARPKGDAGDGSPAAADRPGEGLTRSIGLASGVGAGPTVGDTSLTA
jgi:hypothetical protein